MNAWDKLNSNLHNYWDILVLSLPKIIISILIIAGFSLASVGIGKLFRRKLQRKATDSITVTFVVRLSKFIIIVMGLILAFHAMGFTGVAGGLLAGAGGVAVILGFAFKEIGENFLAGIILVFDRPFNIGDTVTINNDMGRVVNLRFRTTQIKAFDGKDIYIPNAAVIRNNVVNHTRDGLLRQEFTLSISQHDNLEEITELIRKVVNAHADVLNTTGSEETQVLVHELGSDKIIIRVLYWINAIDYRNSISIVKSQIMRDVKLALAQRAEAVKKEKP